MTFDEQVASILSELRAPSGFLWLTPQAVAALAPRVAAAIEMALHEGEASYYHEGREAALAELLGESGT